MSEQSRIALLRALLEGDAKSETVRVGIGDDAAVLAPAAEPLVWTVDVQVDGTHFTPAWVSWEDIGWRSFMAAASDLAAMGASPLAALSSLVLAPDVDDDALAKLGRGQAAAARTVGAPVVGGNLSRGKETSITTTLLGRCAEAPVLRSGARPGDGLWLAGPVGLAAAGLGILMHTTLMQNAIDATEARAACLDAWRRPRALIDAGRALAGHAHAAIDVSDGLARDAAQLAEASDVRVVLHAASVLATGGAALTAVAALLGRLPLDLALDGGEDYALLAASPVPLAGFVQIGVIEAAEGGPRLLLFTPDGETEPRAPRGFDHFP